MSFYILFAIIILANSTGTYRCPDSLSLSNNDLLELCYKKGEELCLKGFDRGKPECKLKIIREEYDSHFDAIITTVESPNYSTPTKDFNFIPPGAYFRFKIDRITGKILVVNNDYASFFRYTKSKQSRPRSKKEDILEKAKSDLVKVNSRTENIRFYYLSFDPNMSSGGPVWRATFKRTFKGFPFHYDYIKICIDDDCNLTSYHEKLNSKINIAEVKIEPKEAIEKSVRYSKKIFDHFANGANIKYKGSIYLDCTLLIINPYNFPIKSCFSKVFYRNPSDAVLTYQTVLYLICAPRIGQHQKSTHYEKVIIYIDAATGLFLCADWAM